MTHKDAYAIGRRRRQMLLWILAILALTMATVATISYYRPLFGFQNSPEVLKWEFAVRDGFLGLRRIGPSSGGAYTMSNVGIPLVFQMISYKNSPLFFGLAPRPSFDGWELAVHLWPLVGGFWAYPVTAVAIEGARDIKRRRRGLCLKCGYDLTGNVSGACSECGCPVERSK